MLARLYKSVKYLMSLNEKSRMLTKPPMETKSGCIGRSRSFNKDKSWIR